MFGVLVCDVETDESSTWGGGCCLLGRLSIVSVAMRKEAKHSKREECCSCAWRSGSRSSIFVFFMIQLCCHYYYYTVVCTKSPPIRFHVFIAITHGKNKYLVFLIAGNIKLSISTLLLCSTEIVIADSNAANSGATLNLTH
jgi:hypothetical protein